MERILIVDDQHANRFLLLQILSSYNFHCCDVESGELAIEKVKNEHFDLILLDILMPGTDGWQTAFTIREMGNKTPIIMLTAMNDENSIAKSFENGASDYIQKPINEIELISRIENVLNVKRAERKSKELITKMKDELITAAEVQSVIIPKREFGNKISSHSTTGN